MTTTHRKRIKKTDYNERPIQELSIEGILEEVEQKNREAYQQNNDTPLHTPRKDPIFPEQAITIPPFHPEIIAQMTE